MSFFFPKPNEFNLRINLMGKSGSGKSGLVAAAFPGALWLCPNPEGATLTATKVCGYKPTTVRVSQIDPFDFNVAFKNSVWNIVQAENGTAIIDNGSYVPVYTAHPESVVDGTSVVLVDMEFGWWSANSDGSYQQNYSALVVDDIDIPMRAALDRSLREAGVNANDLNSNDSPTKAKAIGLRAQLYADYRTYYDIVLREFDEVAKAGCITVISTTKVTINDKDSKGKPVKYMPDFGSAAFDAKSAFFSNLEVNYLVNAEAEPQSILDVPTSLGMVGRRHQCLLNTDPNDEQNFIKNRFMLASAQAPANLRVIMAADSPVYHCPRLIGHEWADELALKVSNCLIQLAGGKRPTDSQIKQVWDEMAKEYFKPQYRLPGCPTDRESLVRFHSPFFVWAFRDGLHMSVVTNLINKQYDSAFTF